MDTVDNVYSTDPKSLVVMRLKEMIERTEGPDKCVICEAIHQLEQPSDSKFDGSIWMIRIFCLIFGGFGGKSLDLELISKILNSSVNKEKEEETK